MMMTHTALFLTLPDSRCFLFPRRLSQSGIEVTCPRQSNATAQMKRCNKVPVDFRPSRGGLAPATRSDPRRPRKAERNGLRERVRTPESSNGGPLRRPGVTGTILSVLSKDALYPLVLEAKAGSREAMEQLLVAVRPLL